MQTRRGVDSDEKFNDAMMVHNGNSNNIVMMIPFFVNCIYTCNVLMRDANKSEMIHPNFNSQNSMEIPIQKRKHD